MEKHPMAGIAVKIEEGPLKGQYFRVIDYLSRQFQGKEMDRIAEREPRLVTPVVGRGYPLDEKIVYGELYPSMEKICVHDNELKVKTAKPPLKIVEGGQDDTRTTSEGDNPTTSTEPAGSDGRDVSSAAASSEDGLSTNEVAEDNSDAGGGDSGVEKESTPVNKRKTKTDKR